MPEREICRTLIVLHFGVWLLGMICPSRYLHLCFSEYIKHCSRTILNHAGYLVSLTLFSRMKLGVKTFEKLILPVFFQILFCKFYM